MKLFKIILFSLFFQGVAFAQNDSTQIANLYQQTFDGISNGDFNKAFDFTYPKLFDHFPKEMLVKATEEAMNQEGIEIGFTESKMLSINFLGEVKGIKYQKVTYFSKMYMRVAKNDEADSEFDMNSFMLMSLKKSFGADNVSLDEATDTYWINAEKVGLAILDPEYNGWKVLTYEPHMEPLVEKFIPRSILDQL